MTKTTLQSVLYRAMSRAGSWVRSDGATILVYHSLSRRNDQYSVTLNDFAEQMRVLSETTRFLSLDEIVTAHREGKTVSGVCITFDDGYKDVLSALPMLEKYQIPAAVFTLSDPSRANRVELDNPRPLLTKKDLRTLLRHGVTIGCHSATHPDFSSLSIPATYNEVSIAKTQLEETLGVAVKYFAYPKGRFTTDVVQAVKYAEYDAAFAVSHACVSARSNQFVLPRIIIDKSYVAAHFPSRIEPGTQVVRGTLDRFRKVYL